MAQWNHTDRTLVAKLVYYGPALGGKTTNLQQIHKITDPSDGGRLISLDTGGDRTLFFDLLPFDLGSLFGYSIKFQIYTVPGQVRYNTTRRLVLNGADGIVFVTDSSPLKEQENKAAWENLRTNLRVLGQDISKVPVVVQCNKQDLPGALDAARIEADLRSGVTGIPAIASEGSGVIETLSAALQATLRRLMEASGSRSMRLDPAELAENVSRVLSRFTSERPASKGLSHAPGSPPSAGAQLEGKAAAGQEATISSEDLLSRSVEAYMSMASEYTEMRDLKNRLAARVRELEALHAAVREMFQARDETRVMERLASAAIVIQGACGASVLLESTGKTKLEERILRRLPFDPANSLTDGETSFARRLLDAGEPFVARDIRWDVPGGKEEQGPFAAVRSMMAAPVPCREHARGLLVVYSGSDSARSFSTEDLRFISLLAFQGATALDNAVLHRTMVRHNERLEDEVGRRTEELRNAYDKLRDLDRMKDRFISNISHEMRTPLTGILATAEILGTMEEDSTERAEFISIIRQDARRLADMIEEVIQLWVLREGGGRPKIEPVNLVHVVEQAVAESQTKAAEHGVPILAGPFKGPLYLTGDHYLLRRAVKELLGNAIKFSRKGEPVEVQIAREENAGSGMQACAITVQDHGQGIPPSELQRVMEQFEQAGDVLTSKPPGLGLGLPLVCEILKHHGGRLEMECPPGDGTIARLIIPVRLFEPEVALVRTSDEEVENAPPRGAAR